MYQTFGFGEIERADVSVRASALDLRLHFFEALVNHRKHALKKLVRVANFDLISDELKSHTSDEELFSHYFVYLFGNNPHKVKARPEIVNTPLKHFLFYRETNKKKLAKFLKEESSRNYFSGRDLRQAALKRLIPDWAALESDPNAESLCNAIMNWSKEYNLTNDWCLDFALLVLINFVAAFKFDTEEFDDKQTILTKASHYAFLFKYYLNDSLRVSGTDYHLKNLSKELWKLADSEIVVPNFTFKHQEFEFCSEPWFPYINRRSVYLDETIQRFNRITEEIKDFARSFHINESLRQELDRYCDEVEKRKSSEPDQIPSMVFKLTHLGLEDYSDSWDPLRSGRENFIANFISKIDENTERVRKIYNSLKPLKIKTFELSLTVYCNKVERSFRENYKKTPRKSNYHTHFQWLIEYQVPPCKSHKRLANELSFGKKLTDSAVRKALERLASSIGLTLRDALRTGRTRGVKEARPRRVAER
jgi:hypothetical protein